MRLPAPSACQASAETGGLHVSRLQGGFHVRMGDWISRTGTKRITSTFLRHFSCWLRSVYKQIVLNKFRYCYKNWKYSWRREERLVLFRSYSIGGFTMSILSRNLFYFICLFHRKLNFKHVLCVLFTLLLSHKPLKLEFFLLWRSFHEEATVSSNFVNHEDTEIILRQLLEDLNYITV